MGPLGVPNMNGDNTLLKALLKTAPKNSMAFNSSITTSPLLPVVASSPDQKNSSLIINPMVLTQDMILNNQNQLMMNVSKQEPGISQDMMIMCSNNTNVDVGISSGNEQTKKKAKGANKLAKQQLQQQGLNAGGQSKSSVFKLNEGTIILKYNRDLMGIVSTKELYILIYYLKNFFLKRSSFSF